MNAVATSESTTARYPKMGRRENVETSVETIPVPGRKMMYTSGWPKNQKRCWKRSGSPRCSTSKKCVWTRRSRMSAVLASITEGIANKTMNDVTPCDHTNTGTRFNVIPGARILKAVVINETATASDATSVKVISWAHTSARLLGVYKLSDSGG